MRACARRSPPASSGSNRASTGRKPQEASDMFAPFVIAAALSSIAGAADVPATPDAQLVLEIRAKAIYPDDKSFARAGDSGADSVASFIYIGPTGCELGASN